MLTDPTVQWMFGLGVAALTVVIGIIWKIVDRATAQMQTTMERHLSDEAGSLSAIRHLGEELKTANVALRERMTAIEAKQAAMPSITAITQLVVENTKLGGEIQRLAEALSGLRSLVDRISRVSERQEDFLMNKGRGG